MNHTLMTSTVVMLLALGLTACGEKTTTEKATDAAKTTGTAVGDAAKATGTAVKDAAVATGTAVSDATKATGEFLTESKDSAVKTAQETLDGLEKKWADLQAKAAPVTDEAKAAFQKAKDEMSQALAYAKTKLVEAKNASADVWQKDAKPALDTAVQKAKNLYEDVAAKFSNPK
jgi:hypothetical protein